MDESNQKQADEADEFATSSKQAELSFFAELLEFLRDNKRWWLWPIVLSLLLLGALVVLNGTGAAPFVYSFF